jgi:hypothetical protein
MKRRHLIQYGLFSITSFLVNLAILNLKQSVAFSSKNISKKQMYDWIFLYWMPYDNNLSGFGKPILQMLAKGVQNENILVVVESDFSGAKQLSRNVITKGNIDTQKLETANSADEKVFAEYLNWAKSKFDAKKWAIVFLGHGGCLDEISPDEHPEPGVYSETKWMNTKKLSDILANFNREVENRVELVFFQNCNKGTIETIYSFRDTAKYTLSSQILLGAPNYYYEPVFQFLGRHPEINGGQLAEKIMEFEPRDMYYSYTVTNNDAVGKLSEKINPLIDSILSADTKSISKSEFETYTYIDEQFVDVVSFFQTITKRAGAAQQKCNEFLEFFKQSMIYKLEQNGTLLGSSSKHQTLSGLGMFLPTSRQELEKYRYLQVYSDLKLAELFDAIL